MDKIHYSIFSNGKSKKEIKKIKPLKNSNMNKTKLEKKEKFDLSNVLQCHLSLFLKLDLGADSH